MKNFLFATIVLFVATWFTTGCQKENDIVHISLLIGSWTESHEENPPQQIQIFRPSDYKEFPVSWYRQIFIFKDDNKCDYLKLAPNDAHYMLKGTWAYEENNRILMIFNQEYEVAHKYELLELKKDLLKLRRLY